MGRRGSNKNTVQQTTPTMRNNEFQNASRITVSYTHLSSNDEEDLSDHDAVGSNKSITPLLNNTADADVNIEPIRPVTDILNEQQADLSKSSSQTLGQLPKTFILQDPAVWEVDLSVVVDHILENPPEQDLNTDF